MRPKRDDDTKKWLGLKKIRERASSICEAGGRKGGAVKQSAGWNRTSFSHLLIILRAHSQPKILFFTFA
jgi:hypothetical protein